MSDILLSNELNVHDILTNLITADVHESNVAISLSSGIDSASILFALLECGKNVTVYSFTLEDRESRDFSVARELANRYSLKFIPVYLPIDITSLKSDVLRLHNIYGCVKKTQYECTWPYLYLFDKLEEHVLATGIGSDSHFVLSKRGMMHFKNNPRAFREMYFSNPNNGQRPQRNKLCAEFDVLLFEPYFSDEMYNYFLDTTWEECNKPRQKQPILNAFPDEFAKMKIHPHTNYQLGDSGISKHFEALLDTDWNIHNYKSVVGIFNSINRGELDGRRKLI